METDVAPRRHAPPVVALAAPQTGRSAGLAREYGATVDEINALGSQAEVLFRRLVTQRETLRDEMSIQVSGGLSPHMDAALKAFQEHDATRRRVHAS